jgi:hypothetical protein
LTFTFFHFFVFPLPPFRGLFEGTKEILVSFVFIGILMLWNSSWLACHSFRFLFRTFLPPSVGSCQVGLLFTILLMFELLLRTGFFASGVTPFYIPNDDIYFNFSEDISWYRVGSSSSYIGVGARTLLVDINGPLVGVAYHSFFGSGVNGIDGITSHVVWEPIFGDSPAYAEGYIVFTLPDVA